MSGSFNDAWRKFQRLLFGQPRAAVHTHWNELAGHSHPHEHAHSHGDGDEHPHLHDHVHTHNHPHDHEH